MTLSTRHTDGFSPKLKGKRSWRGGRRTEKPQQRAKFRAGPQLSNQMGMPPWASEPQVMWRLGQCILHHRTAFRMRLESHHRWMEVCLAQETPRQALLSLMWIPR